MAKILMIAPYQTSFIKGDLKHLSDHHIVEFRQKEWKSKKLVPFLFLSQFFFLLFNLRKFDACIIQFGGYWSYFPTILGRIYKTPTFIILHGSDCAAIPSISYGNLIKNPLKWFIRKSLMNANELWPVSKSLVSTNNSYFNFNSLNEEKQGFQNIIGPIKTPVTVISNGLDLEFWKIERKPSPKNTFITVVSGEDQFIRKGIDLILESASDLPNCTFSIVGMHKPETLECTSNVTFHGRVSQEKMIDLFSQNQFYLQLSVFEGFGLALCESMLCYCIPVVSNVNVLPEIIDNSGFILEKRDKKQLVDLINSLNGKDINSLEIKAKEAIASKYDIQKRIKQFNDRIEQFTKKG